MLFSDVASSVLGLEEKDSPGVFDSAVNGETLSAVELIVDDAVAVTCQTGDMLMYEHTAVGCAPKQGEWR